MIGKVPLIPPNLRKNETIIQIADSLEHLSKVVDHIFLQIENRIDTYSTKLNGVANRVDIVDRKISQLRTVKNAIQVFSSSKYPAADIDTRYPLMFTAEAIIPIQRHSVSQKYPLKRDEPLEKLHIYHVQLSKIEPEKIEGLGTIPNDVNCVNDLLLYNSGKNLYKEFTISDSLRVTHPTVQTEENKINIGTAPVSIRDGTPITNLSNQTYFYSPDLGEVPSLDIPLDLPDLPGIADNVRYNEDSNFGIAPSVLMSPSESNQTATDSLNEDLEGLPEIIPSEPPPPKQIENIKNLELLEETKQQIEIAVKEEKKLEEPLSEPKLEVISHQEPVEKLPLIPDARASLMEAIREAGGAKKLKSVSKQENITKSEKSGGDLMADLHAKLAMRRKGISGTQNKTENVALDSRGALSLMSSLIPAPEETNEELTDQDEDWE
ncbi:hypothetical protein HHI36_005877 [Cryptolaemus montrouzieri]|uniref:WH2 domain-containing protein n=1 Tax=Cryptolaemus montrouzieri TaxID=559131 RepID=A0ABD2NVN1_9CUCU